MIKYKIKPFDEGADAQCFVGSHWRLIPNNYSGRIPYLVVEIVHSNSTY